MVEVPRVRHYGELFGQKRFDDSRGTRVKKERCLAMNPWIAKALVLTSIVVMIAIRAPHGHRSRIVKVATSYKTPLETGLLVLAWGRILCPSDVGRVASVLVR